jgi:hypothetical protein
LSGCSCRCVNGFTGNNCDVAPTTTSVTTNTGTTTTTITSTTATSTSITSTTIYDPGNVDCEEEQDPCTAACEAGAQRNYTLLVAAVKGGKACTGAIDCTPGVGGCPITTTSTTTTPIATTITTTTIYDAANVDCDEAQSPCTAECELATKRNYSLLTPAVKNGRACVGPTNCQPGEDACPTTSSTTSTSTPTDAAPFTKADTTTIANSDDINSSSTASAKKKKGTSGGVIAAILIVLLLVVLGAIGAMVHRSKNNRNAIPVGLTVQNAAFQIPPPAAAETNATNTTNGQTQSGSTLFSIPMEADPDGGGGGAVLVDAVNNTTTGSGGGGAVGGEGRANAPRNGGEPRKLYKIVGSAVGQHQPPATAAAATANDQVVYTNVVVNGGQPAAPVMYAILDQHIVAADGAAANDQVVYTDVAVNNGQPAVPVVYAMLDQHVVAAGGAAGGNVYYDADPIGLHAEPPIYANDYAEMIAPVVEGGGGGDGGGKAAEQSDV